MVRKVNRLTSAYNLMKLGPRVEKIDAAKADVALAQADLDKAQMAVRQLHCPRPGLRHDPQEKRRRREHRQPDRLQRLV